MDIIGIITGGLGLAWTIYGVWSSGRLKKHLLSERDMIKAKVRDIRAFMEKHRQILLNDRQIQNNRRLNYVEFRIEDIERAPLTYSTGSSSSLRRLDNVQDVVVSLPFVSASSLWRQAAGLLLKRFFRFC